VSADLVTLGVRSAERRCEHEHERDRDGHQPPAGQAVVGEQA